MIMTISRKSVKWNLNCIIQAKWKDNRLRCCNHDNRYCYSSCGNATLFHCHLYVSFMDLDVGLFGCEERMRIQTSHHNSCSSRKTGMQQLVLPNTFLLGLRYYWTAKVILLSSLLSPDVIMMMHRHLPSSLTYQWQSRTWISVHILRLILPFTRFCQEISCFAKINDNFRCRIFELPSNKEWANPCRNKLIRDK